VDGQHTSHERHEYRYEKINKYKGSSLSMQPLVFWPRAGAFGAGAILELCAQLVWCELYDMKDKKK